MNNGCDFHWGTKALQHLVFTHTSVCFCLPVIETFNKLFA